MVTQLKKETVPLFGPYILKWQKWRSKERRPYYCLAAEKHSISAFPPYAIDMRPLQALTFGTLDGVGVPYNGDQHAQMGCPDIYHPTVIAQYELAHGNAYVATGDQKHREAFVIQANWLVAHGSRLADDRGGWTMPFPSPRYNALNHWLSALTQGNCISVLARAYHLTNKHIFLQAARRAIRTFELDIKGGGVSTSIGEPGIFFEEVAACPTAHILNGYILALFGLYDYVALTNDSLVAELIQRSLITLHALIDTFDTGYWSYYDLRFEGLAPRFYHALHITLLQALTERWEVYQHNFLCRMRYLITVLAARAYGLSAQ